jgi:hypothetical protein
MSKKNKNRHPNHNPQHSESPHKDESTKRHVYVEPGVQIDLVERFRNEYDASQKQNARYNKSILFWTKVSAGLIFIYAALTLWLGWSSKRAADAAGHTLYFDERAWVVPEGARTFNPPTNAIEVGKPLIIRVGYENTGKSPAINTTFLSLIGYAHTNGQLLNVSPAFDPSKYTPQFVGAMMPYSPLATHFTDITFSSALLQQDFDDIKSDRLHVFAHGKLVYCDIFGREHWVTFCYHLLAGGAYEVCQQENDVDPENQVTSCPVRPSNPQPR